MFSTHNARSVAPADPLLDLATAQLAWLGDVVAPRLERFMGYYRNPARPLTAFLPTSSNATLPTRPYRLFQEVGLPARITGFRVNSEGDAQPSGTQPLDVRRKEVVIENDIAWRLNTLVDFTTGQMPIITSTARNPERRALLTRFVNEVLARAGGVELLAELTLRAAVHGTSYLQIEPRPALLARLSMPDQTAALAADASPAATVPDEGQGAMPGEGVEGGSPGVADAMLARSEHATRITPAPEIWAEAVDAISLRTASATRICPLGSPTPPAHDDIAAFVVLHDVNDSDTPPATLMQRLRTWLSRSNTPEGLLEARQRFTFDLIEPTRWRRFVRGQLVSEGPNPLGFLPYVALNNSADPARDAAIAPTGARQVPLGLSDVEPLIPLQDELNTRLSDRAYRLTMQSARVYLGKGIADFATTPVTPGQMWATDNLDASVETFGGDASVSGEEAHINEIREALDKISGVTPVAAGLLRGKVGNLTSAVALRVTLIALLAKTQRRRAALTTVLQTTFARVLDALDRAGLFHSNPDERGLDLNWPSALPENDTERLEQAQLKVALGVPKRTVLAELGYDEVAPPPQS